MADSPGDSNPIYKNSYSKEYDHLTDEEVSKPFYNGF